jgi:hypothetical protein
MRYGEVPHSLLTVSVLTGIQSAPRMLEYSPVAVFLNGEVYSLSENERKRR